jgi:hypothetical protein
LPRAKTWPSAAMHVAKRFNERRQLGRGNGGKSPLLGGKVIGNPLLHGGNYGAIKRRRRVGSAARAQSTNGNRVLA